MVKHTIPDITDDSESFADSMNNVFNSLPQTEKLGTLKVSPTFSGFVECSGTVAPLRSNTLSEKERKDLLDMLDE